MVDLLMNFKDARDYVKNHGLDAFIAKVEKESARPLELYACSTFWIDNSKYVCKLKGKYGDIIIGWFGIHE